MKKLIFICLICSISFLTCSKQGTSSVQEKDALPDIGEGIVDKTKEIKGKDDIETALLFAGCFPLYEKAIPVVDSTAIEELRAVLKEYAQICQDSCSEAVETNLEQLQIYLSTSEGTTKKE